jgi:hypothetical protein
MKHNIKVISLILLAFQVTSNLRSADLLSPASLNKTIDHIYNLLQNTQCKKDIPAEPFVIGEDKGLYRSYIHVNVMDDYNTIISKSVREYAKIPDMNMFVTSFVVYALLETYSFDGIPELDVTSLQDALNGLLKFQDKNYNSTIPLYTFWKQIDINGTWSQHPDNMCNVVEFVDKYNNPKIIDFVEKLGFKELADLLRAGEEMESGFKNAYKIPSDTDDTSINLGLTGVIHKMTELGNITDFWINNNTDIQGLFDYIKLYSYTPFDETFDHHFIDSRTYYVLRDFLTEQYEKNNTDIRLPTTWVMDLARDKKYTPLIAMPFAVNNVDFNVAANFLFGVTNILLYHKDQEYIRRAFDLEVRKLYSTTVDLLIWVIKNDRLKYRPDLAFLYYPSIFDFYWLLTRTFSTLKNYNFDSDPDKDFFTDIRDRLEDILKNEGSEQILSRMNKSDQGSYFMEFLGDHAGVNRCEDCVFATGLALNSLLNIWTINSKGSHGLTIRFESTSNSSHNIPEVVDDIVKYIINSFDSWFGPDAEGAFFSGSMKTMGTFPFFFPSNYNSFFNGTLIDPHDDDSIQRIGINMTSGVKGYVSEDEYTKMLNETWYGYEVPTEEQYLNDKPFPYWSSPSITYAINLLGLAKYRKLENKTANNYLFE